MSSINELIELNRINRTQWNSIRWIEFDWVLKSNTIEQNPLKHVRLPDRQLGDWMQLTRELSANSGTVTKPSYQTQNVAVLLIITEQTKLSTVTISREQ